MDGNCQSVFIFTKSFDGNDVRYIMFGQFWRRLGGVRPLGLLGGMAMSMGPFWGTSEANAKYNQKLKKKLNEKYHDRKDISLELSEEFRQNMVLFTGNSNKALAE